MEENDRLSMKRKDIDRVNDDFSDFSLSSPARKIRRLDVDLPPIFEEEETDLAMQEIEVSPVNDERAIVLFKPLHYGHQPNLFVDRDLISGFKNRFLRDASIGDDDHYEDQRSNKCQAVVCWNPAQTSYSQSVGTFQQPRTLEITELDETGEDAVMDDAATEIEEDSGNTCPSFPQPAQQQLQVDPTYGFGLHQWQQQHNYMIPPQLPQVSTTPTPITWFR
ncbi:PREDICTED: uncharacterized protein LOC104719246 isoform X3 [Camelina sativa]|uniref:Uncharacterized protein LOC104719246 isoform X1 n=1 Tax=Camelina sativa TaxID=90675 RepID=A0ABM0U6J7_CAMSA|nr:PREDICTED: uncharacterized protein LOC104719246 isoform X1 [Camelina sativa]XP_010436671.2 PREDICTED: uncharacterized protein LOC104719246 isoform X2 [Camelina sativa]XP_019086803.1 PREDICTED: uncharacterized protein LOC104719246 isoform X3 [Camelina sativa]